MGNLLWFLCALIFWTTHFFCWCGKGIREEREIAENVEMDSSSGNGVYSSLDAHRNYSRRIGEKRHLFQGCRADLVRRRHPPFPARASYPLCSYLSRDSTLAGYGPTRWRNRPSVPRYTPSFPTVANMAPFAICSSWFWWFMLTQAMRLTTLFSMSL
jgi:hypothetical protein